MAKNRLTQDELNRDELAEGVHQSVLFLHQHYGKILIAALAVLIGILAYASIRQRDERIAGQVNNAIGNALMRLGEIEAQTDPKQRTDQADALAKSLDDAIKTYPDNRLAKQVYFLKGKALFAADRFKEAQDSYQTFINAAATPEEMARGEMALGYAYENQAFLTDNNTQQKELLRAAFSSYNRAAQIAPGSYIASYATMGQARVHEALGEKNQAIALYKKVIKERLVPSAGVAASTVDNQKETDLIRFLRRELQRQESQLSFQNTAQLRLASLKGTETTGTLTQPAEATTTAPAAKSTATP